MEPIREHCLVALPDFSPRLVVTEMEVSDGQTIYIAREDLLAGGSKQRATVPYLNTLAKAGAKAISYASPFAGYAQVALAASSPYSDLACHIFAERDPRTGLAHEFSRRAERFGARLHLCDSLAEAEERALLGLKCETFERIYIREVKNQLTQWAAKTGLWPTRAWVPVGSGTLAHVMRKALPASTQLLCVDVHVIAAGDARIAAVRQLPNSEYFSAPEMFADPAQVGAPLPSNIHYDAKLWRYVREMGRAGDLWWNVAR